MPKVFGSQFRETAVIAGPAIVLVAFAFWFAYQFVEPAPPGTVTMTTGSPSGGYYAFAQKYKERLKEAGVNLEVKSSAGSVENLKRLQGPNRQAELALLQGGIADRNTAPDLVSLGRVFLEPLWVFYRDGERLDRLSQLAGKRIAIGPEGSGTRALASDLLTINEINAGNTTLLPLGGDQAAAALRSGEIDAAILVLAAESKLVRELLRAPDIKLMSFTNAEAYTRLLPYLSRVTLPAGVIDLPRQIPDSDVTLIAAQAALVAHKDLHPAIVVLMAQAAQEVHSGGGMFQRVEEFPKTHDPELPMAADAERLYKQGAPLLQRYLPFWLANFIERMIVMIVPIATILVPLFKIAPWLYQWRIRRRILHWYRELKLLEGKLAKSAEPGQEEIAEIERIEAAVAHIPVPLQYSDKLYELRSAVDLVRQRLLERSLPGNALTPRRTVSGA